MIQNKIRYILLNRSSHQKGGAVLLEDIRRLNQLFIESCEKGLHEVVRLRLADERINPGAENNLAFFWASYYGHHKVVRLLLADPRVDLTAQDNYAIEKAREKDNYEVLILLLADSRVDLENTHVDFELYDPNQKPSDNKKHSSSDPSKNKKPRKRRVKRKPIAKKPIEA